MRRAIILPVLAAMLACASCQTAKRPGDESPLSPAAGGSSAGMGAVATDTVALEIGGEGGTAIIHREGGAVVRIAAVIYGETFRSERDYQLDGSTGALTYLSERLHRYNRPIYYDAAAAKENNDTEAFDERKGTWIHYEHYFENGKLVRRTNDIAEAEDQTQYERIGEEILDALAEIRNSI